MSQSTDEGSSHTAPSRSSQETRQDREQPNINFAFLVHSRDTFNQPPSVDNKSLARQRRKRTSPEDQAILEAEFQRDPKPDKLRRLDIVQRVALGDKEIQIWFQNRRQSKRRKSGPSVSYEILPRHESTPNQSHTSPDVASDASPPHEPTSSNEQPLKVNTPASSQSSFSLVNSAPTTITSHGKSSPLGGDAVSLASSMSSSPKPESSQQDATHAAGDSPSSTQSALQPLQPQPQGMEIPTGPTPIIEEPHSTFRLSMTSDGGARIISSKEATPSPPRSQPLAPTPFATRQSLRRSYSNASAKEISERPRNLSRLLERRPSGRSRDSRAWEFWCDSEARNELIAKAHRDTTGSAVDAIKLIRSNSASRRHYLSASAGRRSEVLPGHESQQTPSAGSSHSESDKENRFPAEDQKLVSAKRLDSSRGVDHPRRAVLGESQTVPAVHSDNVGLGIRGASRGECQGLDSGRSGGGKVNERGNGNDEDDDEVERFMRGGGFSDAYKRTGSALDKTTDERDDEMDCVAGLLSLSKGNWR